MCVCVCVCVCVYIYVCVCVCVQRKLEDIDENRMEAERKLESQTEKLKVTDTTHDTIVAEISKSYAVLLYMTVHGALHFVQAKLRISHTCIVTEHSLPTNKFVYDV